MRSVLVRAGVLVAPVLLICAVAMSRLTTPAQAAAQETSESAIRSVWPILDALWNARDAERFSELFAVDGSLEFVDRGQALKSRATIHRHFAEQFPRFAPDVRHLTSVHEIRGVAPNVYTVDGKVEILRNGTGGSAAPSVLRTFAIFAVMLQTGEGWKIHTLRAVELSARNASPTAFDGLLRPGEKPVQELAEGSKAVGGRHLSELDDHARTPMSQSWRKHQITSPTS
jgi:uncharacterized protein (TIGR02246 family)